MTDDDIAVPWDELLSKLTQSSNQKCSIRLLDTCFINGKVTGKRAQWYYTTKNGSIAKKKKDKTKAEDIATRFGRFALANPNNTDQYVGNLVKPNGQRIYITISELEEFLQDTKSFECFGIDYKTFLQVYLRPQNGVDQVAVACYTAGETKCSMKANDSVELTDIGVIENSEFISNQMSMFTNEIVAFLKGEALSVHSMSTEFVIDDNGHIWLSRVSQLNVSPLKENTTEKTEDTSIPLTESTLAQARKNPTPATTSELLPDLPPRTTSSQGRVKNPDIVLSPGKLLRKEGGVYKCSLGPDDLPGLRVWVLTGINSGSSEENKWAIDLNEYTKRSGINKDFESLRDNRATLRRSTSSLMVSFVVKAEALITGEEPLANEDDLKKKWKTAYEDALVSDSFKLSSGDVKICGNCEAIVAKLQSLISVDFKAGVLPPQNDESGNGAVENVLDEQPEGYVETRSPTLATSSEVDNSKHGDKSNQKSKDKPSSYETAGHRKGKKGASSSSKKSKENQGPSMDMLAKFAAERDRQQQLLAEQERLMGMDGVDETHKPTKPTKDKTSKKENKKNSKEKDQPPVNTLAENEKRLLELEKQANDKVSRYMQPEKPFVAPGSVISTSEESFLMRQSAQGDVSQFSTLHNKDDDSVNSQPQNVMSNLDHERDKRVIVQLKDQLDEKSTLIAQLQTSVQSKDVELHALERKNIELNKRFSEYRNNADEEKDDKITDLESEILQLKDKYSQSMAKYTMQDAAMHQATLKQVADSGGASTQGTNALIAQLDSLRAELRSVTEKSIADRKAVQTDASIKYLSAEKKATAEAQQLRITISDLEDKASRLEDDLDTEKRKTHGLSEVSRNLETARLEAVNTQHKLRADLKSMQQSMASTYKMESSQNIGIGVDADTAIKLAEAKSEAKMRQLTNQVEFLKSQLAAELSSVEEMKHVVESAREKSESAKADFRKRMNEAEKKRLRDVEEMESLTEQKYEVRMSELSSLQAKFLSMQNQVQDSLQEGEGARQREEMAKNTSAKYQSQIAVLRQEVEKLNDQISDLREKNDNQMGTANDVNKHSHESMMRRLDNERQYLKSQLASEITLKNELQNSLSACQVQMNDIQRQWTDDVNQLRDEATQAAQETLLSEQGLKQVVIALRADNERGRSQLEDMKSGFVKMRDELRAEQTTMENSRSVKHRLMEELETVRGELALMKEEEARLNVMTKEQIAAVTLSTNEMVAAKNKTITGLQESLARQFAENSEAQKQSILCKEELRQERLLQGRRMESIKIFTALKNWKRVRLNAFFQQWQKNSMLCTAAAQFREKMKQVVKRKVGATVLEQSKKNQKAISDTEFEWNEKMEKALIEKDDEITDITDDYEKSLQEEKDRANEELEERISELNSVHEKKIQDIMERHHDEVDQQEEKRKQLIQDQKVAFKDEMAKHSGMLEQQAYQEKLAAVAAKESELIGKYNGERVDLEDDHDDKIREINKKHQTVVADTMYQMEKEKQTDLMALGKQHEVNIEDLKQLHVEALQELSQQKTLELEEAEKAWETQHRENMSAVKQRCHEQGEERLRDMRAMWETELQEKLAEKEHKWVAQIELDVEAANNAAVEVKNKLVKLETTKWQQVLREAEKRFNLEVQKAHQKGFSDCEKKMKDEMFNSAEASKRDIALSEEKFKHQVETIQNDHVEKLEAINNVHAIAITATAESAEKNVRAELAEHMKEHVEKMVSEGKAAVSEEYEKKLHAEQVRYAKLNEDFNKMKVSSAEKVMKLQSDIDMLEMRLKHGEMSSFDQITKLEASLETQREQLERRQKSMLADTKAQLAEEHADNMTKLSAELEADTVRRVEAEKARMAEHLDEQMNDLQDENERLISGLETALSDLKKQKMEVTAELETTTTKLETAEDSLFDSQQAMIMLQKKHSISSWRFASRLMNMNVIFKRELTRARTDASEELAQAEQASKSKLDDFIVLGMNLASVISQVQDAREKVYGTLTSYKTDVLIEKRTHIKLFEKEINRLADEKELMDEQRDNLEEELVQYEKEIEAIEIEIREHTRSSSVMQNGRINVAHARKKKRFDTELERILDLIEQKRSQINDMDDRCQVILSQKDDKESDLADMEKDLVQILIEQQRLVLSQIEEAQVVEDKAKTLVKMSVIAWPPVMSPSKDDISACHRRANKRYREKGGGGGDDYD